jgi:hypothetical protein
MNEGQLYEIFFRIVRHSNEIIIIEEEKEIKKESIREFRLAVKLIYRRDLRFRLIPECLVDRIAIT